MRPFSSALGQGQTQQMFFQGKGLAGPPLSPKQDACPCCVILCCSPCSFGLISLAKAWGRSGTAGPGALPGGYLTSCRALTRAEAQALMALGVGSSLSPRVLEAWAQSAAQRRVQRATITQFQQARPRRLLQTHWAQWRTALRRVWLESGAEAQEASTAHPRPRAPLRHQPRLASKGCLLVIRDTAAPWKQVRSGPDGVGGPEMTQEPGAPKSACFR